MESFSFTKKKLQQQPLARQHKLVSQWLKSIYHEFLDNTFSLNQSAALKRSYNQILQWLNEAVIDWDKDATIEEWIEFIADRYHYHKKLSGIGIAEHNLLPRIKKGDDIKDFVWSPEVPYRVALDNLRSAFNVGSIFRTADATGWESVIIGGTTPGIGNQQVIKTAMGCTNWIPQETTANLSALLESYRKAGFTIIGLETIEDSQNHLEFCWPEKGIVVLGNEEYGISQTVLQCCDSFVHLPMQGKKNSVNVANAFAVISFHIAFSQKTRTS